MTRRPVRIIWGLIGLCLALGAGLGVLAWLGPKGPPWAHQLREFSTVIDLIALTLWMLVFAFYWARHQDD